MHYTMFERTVSSLFSVDNLLTNRSVQLSWGLHVSHESYAGTNDKGHCAMDVPILKKTYTKMLEGCTWIYHWKHLSLVTSIHDWLYVV